MTSIHYVSMTTRHALPRTSEESSITLVTAFLDIGRSTWQTPYERNTIHYLNSAKQFFSYDYEMIMFVDERFVNLLEGWKASSPFGHSKTIIAIDQAWLHQHCHCWRQLERERQIMDSYGYQFLVGERILRQYPENTCAEYNMINHCKIDMICHAIDEHLVPSSHVGWVDFGYFHSILGNDPTAFPTNTLDARRLHPSKMSFCLCHELEESDQDVIHTLCHAPERFTGSFFAGPTRLMHAFQRLYHQVLSEFHDANLCDDDRHLYLRVFWKDPDMFQLYVDDTRWPRALVFFQYGA